MFPTSLYKSNQSGTSTKIMMKQEICNAPQKILGHVEYSNEIFHIQSIDSIVTDERNKITAQQLFGNYVFKNEITILGGSDNTGKSILGMDIAIAVATGHHYWHEDMEIKEQMKVLLVDTELNDSQFTRRYKNLQTNDRLLRAGFWPSIYGRKTTDDILKSLEGIFLTEGYPQLIIVDNLSTIADVSSAKQIQYFLGELKRMKEVYGLTMILITHLNKVTQSKPISKEDFRGSKQLTNMADTVIGIGNTSEGDSVKYISLLKSRNVAKKATVDVVSINESPYLHFEYESDDYVENILYKGEKRGPKPIVNNFIAEQIIEMKKCGLSSRNIASVLGIGKSTVWRFLNNNKIME